MSEFSEAQLLVPEGREAVGDILDQDKIKKLGQLYHLSPPAPYDDYLDFENIGSTLESLRSIEDKIDADANLDPKQRHVLYNELWERWYLVVAEQDG